jgi:hypothetical protein
LPHLGQRARAAKRAIENMRMNQIKNIYMTLENEGKVLIAIYIIGM